MACAICEKRRPRRFCPGAGGDICTLCCGVEREVTVECPLDCEHLREARRHDRPAAFDPAEAPNRDITVTERFLAEHEELITALSRAVAGSALGIEGAVDNDVREALDALIRTYRTLESGVYYETRPANVFAGRIYTEVNQAAQAFRRAETERLGMSRTRDMDVLGGLVFLQRLEFDRNNGRRRGRAFLDFLRGFYPPPARPEAEARPSLIVP
jgi:hypothetical protein